VLYLYPRKSCYANKYPCKNHSQITGPKNQTLADNEVPMMKKQKFGQCGAKYSFHIDIGEIHVNLKAGGFNAKFRDYDW
ncbi:hypothetical protein BGZ52_010296, partial [Haplosporangium bisporale]